MLSTHPLLFKGLAIFEPRGKDQLGYITHIKGSTEHEILTALDEYTDNHRHSYSQSPYKLTYNFPHHSLSITTIENGIRASFGPKSGDTIQFFFTDSTIDTVNADTKEVLGRLENKFRNAFLDTPEKNDASEQKDKIEQSIRFLNAINSK